MGRGRRRRIAAWLATGALAGLVGGFLAGLLRDPQPVPDRGGGVA